MCRFLMFINFRKGKIDDKVRTENPKQRETTREKRKRVQPILLIFPFMNYENDEEACLKVTTSGRVNQTSEKMFLHKLCHEISLDFRV